MAKAELVCMVSSESAPPGFIKHAHFTEHPFTRHSGWWRHRNLFARCASVLNLVSFFCHHCRGMSLFSMTGSDKYPPSSISKLYIPWDTAVAPRTLTYRVSTKVSWWIFCFIVSGSKPSSCSGPSSRGHGPSSLSMASSSASSFSNFFPFSSVSSDAKAWALYLGSRSVARTIIFVSLPLCKR